MAYGLELADASAYIHEHDDASGLHIIRLARSDPPQGLLLIGVPEHRQAIGGHNDIIEHMTEAWFDSWSNPAVVLEGGYRHLPPDTSLDDAVKNHAETGIVSLLARWNSVPARPAEPGSSGYWDIVEFVRQRPELGLTSDHIDAFFAWRSAREWLDLRGRAGIVDHPSLPQHFEDQLKRRRGYAFLHKEALSFDQIMYTLEKSLEDYGGDAYFHDGGLDIDAPGLREFIMRHTTAEDLPPETERSALQHITAACNEPRRQSFVKVLGGLVKKAFSPEFATHKIHTHAIAGAVIEMFVQNTPRCQR